MDLVQETFTILLGYTLHQDFLFCVLVPQLAIDEQILLIVTHQALVFCPISVTAAICQVLDERLSPIRLMRGRRWLSGARHRNHGHQLLV